jgi:hypothetical protein
MRQRKGADPHLVLGHHGRRAVRVRAGMEPGQSLGEVPLFARGNLPQLLVFRGDHPRVRAHMQPAFPVPLHFHGHPARAGDRRFGLLRIPRTIAKAPYKIDLPQRNAKEGKSYRVGPKVGPT